MSSADGSVAAFYETDGSRKTRDEFFKDDGNPDYTGLRNIEDLMGFYDRQMAAMGGIPGEIAVDGNVIYYASASGVVGATRVNGIELPEKDQQ